LNWLDWTTPASPTVNTGRAKVCAEAVRVFKVVSTKTGGHPMSSARFDFFDWLFLALGLAYKSCTYTEVTK
jgi:hypothetical protein